MKISTEIDSAAKIVGEERAVEYIARAGFDAWDFSMFDMCKYNWNETCIVLPNDHPLAGPDYLKFARRLRKIGEDNGIKCNQSHAPFPTSIKELRPYLKRAIECTAEAGGEICVIHPNNDCTPQENAEMYFELLPFAKEHNVKIATENMWNWDKKKDQASAAACSSHQNFKEHLDAVNDDFLVACVDIGHAEMKGLDTSAAEMIKYLGSKVQSLHIHDNDKWHDNHALPFTMDIEFEPILKALKEIEYDGYFTLETSYLRKNGYAADNILKGLKEMADIVKKMGNDFDLL